MYKSSQELILFYNTENFFPPDAAKVHRTDPTNSGLQNWDLRKYTHKLNRIARVFQMVENEEGVLPMIIGLAEIQGTRVLQDLIDLPPFLSRYKFIHYESLDERGVDVALLYDPEKIEILDSEPITYLFETESGNSSYIDTTRDILFCKVRYLDKIINVFVCHLPSKREKDVNKPKRDFILKDLRKKIIAAEEKEESVLLLGDFNENPIEKNIVNITLNERNVIILFNRFAELFTNQKYSTFHINDGLLFDQILYSKDFLGEDSPLKFCRAEIFNADELTNTQDKKFKKPFRTFAGRRYLGGYSDHFPVYISFSKPMQTQTQTQTQTQIHKNTI